MSENTLTNDYISKMRNNPYLYNSNPIPLNPQLAMLLGDADLAIVFQQIQYWLSKNLEQMQMGNCSVDVIRDGRVWCFCKLDQWEEQFIWMSRNTINRKLKKLEDMGLIILGKKGFNKMKGDRTIWYTIDYEAFEKLYQNFEEKNNVRLTKKAERKDKQRAANKKQNATSKKVKVVDTQGTEQLLLPYHQNGDMVNESSNNPPYHQTGDMAYPQVGDMAYPQNGDMAYHQTGDMNNKRLTIQETNLQETNLQETNRVNINQSVSLSRDEVDEKAIETARQTREIQYATDIIKDLHMDELSTFKNSGLLKEIELCILEMYVLDDGITVNKKKIPKALVQSVVSKLNQANIAWVVYKYENVCIPITSKKEYLKSMIYNSAFETNSGFTNEYNTMF